MDRLVRDDRKTTVSQTRMYISRRKCEMVLAVAKLGAGQILVTSMFASIFLA